MEPVKGKCYVITFSRYHNLTLADLEAPQILPVIQAWTRLYTSHLSPQNPLSKAAGATSLPPQGPGDDATSPNQQLRYMQIFENKGAAMGCSNPHPHGQVWTTSSLPEEPGIELANLLEYRGKHGGKHMLEDYATMESRQKERMVFENQSFIALCPWWATWPFEVMIISKSHRRALVDFSKAEQDDLSVALAEVTRRYDNLFETTFPYSESLVQIPFRG